MERDGIPFRSRGLEYSVLLRTIDASETSPATLRLEIEDLSFLSPSCSSNNNNNINNGAPLSPDAALSPLDGRFVGEFSKQYVEDITRKTGNFKKFPTFVKMLLSAFDHGAQMLSGVNAGKTDDTN